MAKIREEDLKEGGLTT